MNAPGTLFQQRFQTVLAGGSLCTEDIHSQFIHLELLASGACRKWRRHVNHVVDAS